jgi:hypothetical protein
MIVLLSASCSTGSGPSDEDLEDYSEGSLEEYDAEGYAGQTFDFSMTADLGQLADAVQDSMETVWTGTFSIDEDGILHGTGSASLNDAIFSDVDGCGYIWYENADFEFTITGEAQQREGSVKLSLVVDLTSDPIPVRTEPVATCEDPGTWQLNTPEIYFDLHRDNMLSTIQLGLQRIGPSIAIGQTREAETGGVAYTILVNLQAIPLTD